MTRRMMSDPEVLRQRIVMVYQSCAMSLDDFGASGGEAFQAVSMVNRCRWVDAVKHARKAVSLELQRLGSEHECQWLPLRTAVEEAAVAMGIETLDESERAC